MALREEVIALLDTISGLHNPTTSVPQNYTDQAPDGTPPPYTVTHMDISETPALRGDGKTLAVTRLFQVSLWEDRSIENEVLWKAIWTTLDGVECLDTFKLAVRSAQRVADRNYDLVHRAFTIAATQRMTP